MAADKTAAKGGEGGPMKALLVPAVVVAAITPVIDKPPVIKEWTVPWPDSRPRDPFVDPTTNRIWFCGQAGNYVAYFVPATGEFKKYDLPPNSGPHNLIVDKAGIVWYSGNLAGYIGRLDPKTGAIWVTSQGGDAVGKLTVSTGRIQLLKVPTHGAHPYGIKLDSHGHPWFMEFGTNQIGTVDPATMQNSMN